MDAMTTPPPVRRGPGSGGVTGRGFQPGQSGNPRGTVRVTKDGRTVAQLARDLTEDALLVLREIAKDKKQAAPVRIQAATAIVSRGWGDAPKVQANLHADLPVRAMSDAQLVQLLGLNGATDSTPGEVIEMGSTPDQSALPPGEKAPSVALPTALPTKTPEKAARA